MNRSRFLIALTSALLAAGCDGLPEPEVIPTVLPGSKLVRPTQEGDEAQSIGEASSLTTVQPPTENTDVSLPLLGATPIGESRSTGTKLEYTTLKAGEGKQARPGQFVTVHYVGTLPSGVKFDSSRDSNKPFRFQIGARSVIRGWDEGVTGMTEGEFRKLVIPPALAYGPNGRPPAIPPNATLHFEIELLKVEDAK